MLQYIIKRVNHNYAFQFNYKQKQLKCVQFNINYLNFSNFDIRSQKIERNYDKIVNIVFAFTNNFEEMMNKTAKH